MHVFLCKGYVIHNIEKADLYILLPDNWSKASGEIWKRNNKPICGD
jgi:hypothetical protein